MKRKEERDGRRSPENAKPADKKSQGKVSGSADSSGGSREGNAGHENNPNTGQGQRQI